MKFTNKSQAVLLGLALVSLSFTLFASTKTPAITSLLQAPSQWESEHFQDHPLVGSVWRGDGKASNWQDLAIALEAAQLVLVGEVHPNVDHHRLQASVLAYVAASTKLPTVVWEMIPSTRQSDLDDWVMATAPDASALGQALEWSDSGWPAWEMYQPIAEVAALHQLKMTGAALPRETMMNIGRHGANGVDEQLQARLHLDVALDQHAHAGLMDSLREGHCGLMPDEALINMAIAQRARDGAMASAMLGEDGKQASVLIAGNAHVRNDWGVAGLLNMLMPQAEILSIAQIEVSADEPDPNFYLEWHDSGDGYDFVVFTPKAEIKDYCAELRKQFGKEE